MRSGPIELEFYEIVALAILALGFFATTARAGDDELQVGRAEVTPPSSGLAPALESDGVAFRNGSVILGDIIAMTRSTLRIKRRDTGEELSVRWGRVATIRSSRPLEIVLEDGRRVVGPVLPGRAWSVRVDTSLPEGPAIVPIRRVAAIDPPEVEPKIDGSVSAGGSRHDGNAQSEALFLRGEIEALLGRHRLAGRAFWNHAESAEAGVTAEEARGEGRWDFFVTDRMFTFVDGTAETDELEDLDLRSVITLGPGYQFVREGDFPEEWLEDVRWLDRLDFRGDLGLSWIHEEYDAARGRDFIAARWSAEIDWQVLPRVTIFHSHQGFPSLEDIEDLRVQTRQGVRVDLPAGFITTAEIQWEWDNVPAPGFDRSDFLYILTLGYAFEF